MNQTPLSLFLFVLIIYLQLSFISMRSLSDESDSQQTPVQVVPNSALLKSLLRVLVDQEIAIHHLIKDKKESSNFESGYFVSFVLIKHSKES